MAGLKLSHVYKTYDNNVTAVADFNLDIVDGEFIVLVGPSGCGKSTTLRMIAGLEEITSGDVFIGDRLVNALEPKERNIAMVFQNYALFPNMTVADNISFGLRMKGENKVVIKEKIRYATDILALQDYLGSKPSQLSGGQRQRVALGRAIVREPDVFLLDEPLSNLDAKLRANLRTELSALHKKLKTTFIYVTHDQVEATTMGDRVVVMKDGFVRQVGTPRQLYEHPADTFVAGFIGTPQMNFISGTLHISADGLSIQTPIGEFPLTEEHKYRFSPKAADGMQVTIGIRPEHIWVGDTTTAMRIGITAEITDVEYLGTHTQVVLQSSGVQFVAKASTEFSQNEGNVTAYFNNAKMLLFDEEGKTLLPILPEYVGVKGEVKKGRLHLLGGELTLPEVVARKLPDGNVTVRIPPRAIKEGNEIKCEPDTAYDGKENNLYRLICGEYRLYSHHLPANAIGLDLSALSFEYNQSVIECLPQNFTIKGCYLRVKEKGEPMKHYVQLGDVRLETFYEFNKKMYRQGKSILAKELLFKLNKHSLRLATQQEILPFFKVVITRVEDYGQRKYLIFNLNGQEISVEGEGKKGEEINVVIDFDKLSVFDAATNALLF